MKETIAAVILITSFGAAIANPLAAVITLSLVVAAFFAAIAFCVIVDED